MGLDKRKFFWYNYTYQGRLIAIIKLDYEIKSPQERVKLVERILAELDTEPTSSYLEILSNYLVQPMEKQERR